MQEVISKQKWGIANYETKLAKNGYGVASGNRLIDFKLEIENQVDPEMNFRIKSNREIKATP